MEQIDLFSYALPRYCITTPIRLIELFSGLGSQASALDRIGADYEHWFACDNDPYAMKSYNAIHGTDFPVSDIKNIHCQDLRITEKDKYTYMLTYSFPCQDISLCGDLNGYSKGSGTRSGLLWEVERILDECTELPQVLVMENVPNLLSKRFIKDFQLWRRKLEQLGYSNYVKCLNAKEYGYPHPIPQNRNRCFMVSILGNYYYEFPKKQKLKLKLKDMLEEDVDEKYYLSEKGIRYITDETRLEKNYTSINSDVAIPITAKGQTNWTGTFISNQDGEGGIANRNATKKGYTIANEGDGIDISTRPKNHRGTVQKGISQTIKSSLDIGVCVSRSTFSENDIKMITDDGNIKRYIDSNVIDEFGEGDGADLSFPNGYKKGNRVMRNCSPTIAVSNYDRIVTKTKNKRIAELVNKTDFTDDPVFLDVYNRDAKEICGTLMEGMQHQQGNIIGSKLAIRKLTPLECFRLQGFTDEEFRKAESVCADSRLYMQSGNSICVNCLASIFKNLFKEEI